MKERPILFNSAMVRAILEDRKTQTRRIMKHTPAPWNTDHTAWDMTLCPYGKPGDRLWVREAWCPIYPQDPNYNGGRPIEIDYRATHSRGMRWRMMDELGTRRWKPSIHMPRWVSRITLEITGVRAERLEDIDQDDAIAEGVSLFYCGPKAAPKSIKRFGIEQPPFFETPRMAYVDLWESINGQSSWALNPWVWVIEFKRVEQ